jgi:hypothetical protein
MTESINRDGYAQGQRRVFPIGYSLPHVSVYVPAGATGTVVYSDEWIVSVKLDDPIPNLVDSEWKNCIDFAVADDPGCVEAFTNLIEAP